MFRSRATKPSAMVWVLATDGRQKSTQKGRVNADRREGTSGKVTEVVDGESEKRHRTGKNEGNAKGSGSLTKEIQKLLPGNQAGIGGRKRGE